MGKESDYTRSLCRVLEAQGCMTYPLIGSSWQPPGWPDRFIAHRSLHQGCAFVEFKLQGEKLEKMQVSRQVALRERGVHAYAAYFARDGSYVGVEGCDEWVQFSGFLEQLRRLTWQSE